MVWIVEIIQLLILTINRQGILRQVIRSDAEEIHHFRQTVADHHAAGVSIIMPCSGIYTALPVLSALPLPLQQLRRFFLPLLLM